MRRPPARAVGLLLTATLLGLVWPARAASPVRYALIVGNNRGNVPAGASPEDLRHAEREAAQLHEALIQYGGFSESRLVLLRGRGRADILAAARKLAEQHRRDRQQWGDVSTLFAFFFTGHGTEGKLLTSDAPLTGSDLAGIFRDVGATLTFGFFDACSSGSLDLHALRAKGLSVMPAFNAFEELPREVITARGTMWVVSSGPGQVSYEDAKLGGVFTHYFIEGISRAKSDDFGISLDAIWEYASRQTQRHTSGVGRAQTPQKLVRELTVAGPVYFSFPRPRSAELAFMSEVAGTFLLRYETGELSELVVKAAGQPTHMRLFPGTVWLERVGDGRRERQKVELVVGGTVRIHARQGWQPARPLGRRQEQVNPKGESLTDLMVVQDTPHVTGLLEAGYRFAWSPDHGTSPLHAAELVLRLDRGSAMASAGISRGWRDETFQTWGYRARRTELAVTAGPAWQTRGVRLGLTAEGRLGWTSVVYDDGVARSHVGFSGGLFADALLPLWPGSWPVFLQVRAGATLENVGSAVPQEASQWSAIPAAAVGLSMRAF